MGTQIMGILRENPQTTTPPAKGENLPWQVAKTNLQKHIAFVRNLM
jgi:hypothetical protein